MSALWTLGDLSALVGTFARDREWEQFHTPRNLVLALVGEVGELAELVQFRSDEDVSSYAESPAGAKAFGDELADIFIYLVRLADVLDVDLGEATSRKVESNAVRYPAEEVKGSAEKRP